MLLKNLLLLIILFGSMIAIACESPRKMERLFFSCNLIAKSKIVSHTEHSYQIKVIDIFHDNDSGIKNGDLITIKKDMNVISSAEKVSIENIKDKPTGVVFLVKSTKGWRIAEFPFFVNQEITIHFNYEYCRVTGNTSEIKHQIQEYYHEFKLDNEKLVGLKTERQVNHSNLGQIALIQYFQLYRFTMHSKIIQRIDCGITPVID